MSGKVVGWAMEQRTGSPAAKLVLVKLADNANENGYCWPSVPLIVEHTELAERTVRGHLRKLQADGLILIEPRMSAKGQISNAYQLNIPRATSRQVSCPPATVAGRGARQMQGAPATVAGNGMQQMQGHKKNRQFEPSLNLPPPSGSSQLGSASPPLKGRGDALARLIGEPEFVAYFGNSELIEGPPHTIVVATEFKAHWTMKRFERALHRVFGKDLYVISRKEAKCTDAGVVAEIATTADNSDNGLPWWARDG